VICQQSATGTVTINVAAGATGFNVALKSSQTCASVPAVVTVPKGATTASFPITTSVVTQSSVATVTASGVGGSATATLAVLPGNGLAPSGWSKFLANASNTPQGLHPAAKGQIAMTVDVFSGPASAPSVAPDGTVYVVEHIFDIKLRALNPNGSTKWSIELPGDHSSWQCAPLIGPNGTVYVAGGNDLYAISPLGKILWDKPAGSYPAFDSHGVLYVGGAGASYGIRVSAITPDGTTKWTTSVPGAAKPTVGADGNIYVGSASGLTKLRPDGAIVWSRAVPWGPWGGGDSIVLADGSIVVWNSTEPSGLSGEGGIPWLAADFTSSGALRWSFDFGSSTGVIGYGANPKGGMYALVWSGTLTCLAMNGTRLWAKEVPGLADGWLNTEVVVEQALAIDSSGDAFVADGNGKVWSFAPTGRLNWACQLGDGSTGAPGVAPNGSVYVSTFGEQHSSPAGGSLYGVSSTGRIDWAHYGCVIYSVPSFGLDGTAYFGGGGGITAFDSAGNFKWCYGNGDFVVGGHNGSVIESLQPTIGSDGTIYYFSTDGFRALTPTGKLKWFYPYTPTASSDLFLLMPAVGPDGTIYFADRNLYALNPDGTLKWSKSYADWLIAMCPLIGPDGTLYLTSQGQTGPQAIYAIAPDGTLLWMSVQAEPFRNISLDKHGNLYTIVFGAMTQLNSSGQVTNSFGGTTSGWFVVGSDGTVCYRDSTTGDIVMSGGHAMGSDWDPFALADDDTIYGVTQNGGTVRAYNNQGELLWALPGVSAWTAQFGLGHFSTGYSLNADRPMSIAPDGSLWVFSGYGFVVIK
jgi:hypothetical protein